MPTGCVKDLCVPEKLFLFLFLLSHFFLVTSLRAVRFLRLFVLTRKGRILCGANIADIASSPVPPQHLTCKLDGRYALCSALAEVQKVRQNESSRCSGLSQWTLKWWSLEHIDTYCNFMHFELLWLWAFFQSSAWFWFGKSATPCN